LAHKPLIGWYSTFGIQTEDTHFSALAADKGLPHTVPCTKSTSLAGFLIEERHFGLVLTSAGLRLESVEHRPYSDTVFTGRKFNLTSYQWAPLWSFMPGYGFDPTISIA